MKKFLALLFPPALWLALPEYK